MAKDFLNATIKANQEIYNILNSGFKQEWCKSYNVGAGGDISCEIDLLAENIFIKHLKDFGQIESEESGIIGSGKQKIVIDPIDGSSNALTNFPYYGSSVALIGEDGLIKCSVVANFANGEIFYKIANEPLFVAYLNSLNFKIEQRVKEPRVGLFERSYAHDRVVKKLNEHNLKYRAPGAVALSLAYAHRVEYVLYVGELRVYDVAAGLALCEDLNVTISDNYVVVAQKKETLNIIENILKEVEDELK